MCYFNQLAYLGTPSALVSILHSYKFPKYCTSCSLVGNRTFLVTWSDKSNQIFDLNSGITTTVTFQEEDEITENSVTFNGKTLSFPLSQTSFVKRCLTDEVSSIDALMNAFEFADLTSTSLEDVVFSLGHVLMSGDHKVHLAFFDVFQTHPDILSPVFDSLLNIEGQPGQHLILLKFLSYFESNRLDDPNQLFLQNNNYIRCILRFITENTMEFKTKVLVRVFFIVSECSVWSFDHPKESDFEIVGFLLTKFWEALTEGIPIIPCTLR